MTIQRNTKYSLCFLQVGQDHLFGAKKGKTIQTIRAAVSAYARRSGRKFKVSVYEHDPNIAVVLRLPDDAKREPGASKYGFHMMEVGDEITLKFSRGAQNSALIYGKRNGKTFTTMRPDSDTLIVRRV